MNLGEYLGAGSAVTKGLYHLNGNSNDDSGNGNNGTDSGSPTYSLDNGKFGQGISYASNKYTNVGSAFNFGRTTPYTFSCWFNTTNTGGNNFIISNEENNPYKGYLIFTDTTAKVRFDFINRFDTARYTLQSSESITSGKRHHLMFTYNGSGPSTTNMVGYLDSVPLTLTATTNSIGANDWVSTTTMYIGARRYDTTQFFNGKLDEIFWENRAWTAIEVQKYYTYALGRFASI